MTIGYNPELTQVGKCSLFHSKELTWCSPMAMGYNPELTQIGKFPLLHQKN
jgi:hypothetical protein